MNNPVNMADFIEAKSDQLNADDLLQGPRTITVTSVSVNPDSAEQPVSIGYEGDNRKPFKPCKTMRRLIVAVWGADTSTYAGRSMTLYRDPSVQFGGMQVGGIRISHMTDIEQEQTVPLMVTRGRKKPFRVKPLKIERDDSALEQAIDKIIANIAKAPSAEKLDAYLQGAAAKPIADAKASRADLADRLEKAVAEQKAALTDDDPFSEQEGGASAQEAQPDEVPPSDWPERISASASVAELGKIEGELLRADGLSDEERAGIDSLIEVRRAELKGGAR